MSSHDFSKGARRLDSPEAPAVIESPAVIEAPQEKTRFSQPPVVGDMQLSARQYVRAKKLRWEQQAGFLHEMKQQQGPMARKTVAQWDVLWGSFWVRTIR
jgi:hypothetical protein